MQLLKALDKNFSWVVLSVIVFYTGIIALSVWTEDFVIQGLQAQYKIGEMVPVSGYKDTMWVIVEELKTGPGGFDNYTPVIAGKLVIEKPEDATYLDIGEDNSSIYWKYTNNTQEWILTSLHPESDPEILIEVTDVEVLK